MDRLSVLHVSDVHSSFDKIRNLEKWLTEEGERLDLILLSGDIADMPMKYGFDDSEEAMKFKESYYEDFQKVVDGLSRINKNVYYIPGNHDVPKAFDIDSRTAPPCSVQCRSLLIAPSLYVAGFGGSVPGYKDGKHYFDGFPYKSQEEMSAELSKFLQPLFNLETTPLKENDRMILMTHCGPNESSTSIARVDPHHPVYSGSTGLDDWLAQPETQSKVLINVHGHTHDSFGESQVGSISILNPGPLLEGRFAIYSFHRDPSTGGPWKHSSVRRYKL